MIIAIVEENFQAIGVLHPVMSVQPAPFRYNLISAGYLGLDNILSVDQVLAYGGPVGRAGGDLVHIDNADVCFAAGGAPIDET